MFEELAKTQEDKERLAEIYFFAQIAYKYQVTVQFRGGLTKSITTKKNL